MGFYPLMLELAGKEILIAGGGKVALRKFKSLQGLGARFTIISPEILPDFGPPGQACRQVLKKFRPEDLGNPFLTLACTGDWEINREIGRCCREKGILVSICDDPAGSDFIFPAVASQGPLKIAVSTCGECPGLAKKIRDEVAMDCAERYSALTREAGTERRAAVRSPEKSEEIKEFEKKLEEEMEKLAKK